MFSTMLVGLGLKKLLPRVNYLSEGKEGTVMIFGVMSLRLCVNLGFSVCRFISCFLNLFRLFS